ncbi:MAG TPA: hypothetical protein PK668_08630 [Myxococcota bacterium]|nr:hypothetical protein [Myxococcota bacterium]HRY92957.1 hypothetical protein [Myxococcota bacterium]HSA22560.1 hypothetical protein [Myxococcota bacterium]
MHLSSVTLDWLVERATAILEVSPLDPEWRPRELACGPGVEPFQHAERKVRVAGVLRAPAGIQAGQELVWTSFCGLSLRLHLDYHLRGISRHVAVEQYAPSVPLPVDPAASRILFLERRAFVRFEPGRDRLTKEIDAHAAVCLGAEEACERRAEIAALAGSSPAPGSLGARGVGIVVGVVGKDGDGELGTRAGDRLGERIRGLFPGEPALSWTLLGMPCNSSKGRD